MTKFITINIVSAPRTFPERNNPETSLDPFPFSGFLHEFMVRFGIFSFRKSSWHQSELVTLCCSTLSSTYIPPSIKIRVGTSFKFVMLLHTALPNSAHLPWNYQARVLNIQVRIKSRSMRPVMISVPLCNRQTSGAVFTTLLLSS